MRVPFFDLRQQFAGIREEILPAVIDVLDSGQYALGPAVTRFESAFAEATGAAHCVGLESGTAALILALLSHGVASGDEVITVAHTFISTAEAISWVGATPVFVDIEPATCTMDPLLLEPAITPRTRAIIPVHIYGQTADMDPILEIGRRHGVPVIQDAAQAHGATYRGRPLGALDAVACYSFYPTKNLGSCGEGGAVVTNDDAFAAECRALRDHGQRRKNVHERIGGNARMQGIQGAVLEVKLRHLDRWTRARQDLAARYDAALRETAVTPVPVAEWGTHVYHLYVARCDARDALREHLDAAGVGTAIHYPTPIHRQPCYESLGLGDGSLPETERAALEVVSLPLYPELPADAVNHVAESIRSFRA